MKHLFGTFLFLLIGVSGQTQTLEICGLKGNFFVRASKIQTDTVFAKVGIDLAVQNDKGLMVIHGLKDFGSDTLLKFQGITVVDQMQSSISKGYNEQGYVYMNNYNISFDEGSPVQKAYLNYDPVFNAYRIILTKGDTAYSVHSDDIAFSNWSKRRFHERAFDLTGFDLFEKGEAGYLKTGVSELEGRIVLGDENVTITLGANTENVPVWYKARQQSVFMYVGDAQEFRIDNERKEIVYLTQLSGEVYQRMYVFKLEQ